MRRVRVSRPAAGEKDVRAHAKQHDSDSYEHGDLFKKLQVTRKVCDMIAIVPSVSSSCENLGTKWTRFIAGLRMIDDDRLNSGSCRLKVLGR